MKKLFYFFTIAIILIGVFTTCNKDVAVTGVKLDETSLTIDVSGTKMLIVTVLPEKATNKAVTWISNNPLVVTVSSNGLVTAISKGEATVEVSTVDGNFTASCKVKVGDTSGGDIAVTGVTLSKTTLSLEIGETETLIPTVLPENATNRAVIWTSSNPLVTTVLPSGLVTALSKGEATIEVTTVDGSFSARCIVNVTVPLTPEELLSQEKGWQLTAGTCDPPYELGDGSPISNLFEGFLYDCELDDIIFFYKNYTQYLNFGKTLCEWESGIGINLGNWKIRESENVLEFQLPYFLDDVRVEGSIVVLDENTLKLDVPITIDYGKKLTKREVMLSSTKTINYVFTLTYSKVSK